MAAHQEYDETAERILRQRGRSFQVLTPIELGSHYFKMGQAVDKMEGPVVTRNVG